jgi:hypothetical protein
MGRVGGHATDDYLSLARFVVRTCGEPSQKTTVTLQRGAPGV